MKALLKCPAKCNFFAGHFAQFPLARHFYPFTRHLKFSPDMYGETGGFRVLCWHRSYVSLRKLCKMLTIPFVAAILGKLSIYLSNSSTLIVDICRNKSRGFLRLTRCERRPGGEYLGWTTHSFSKLIYHI